MIRLFRKNGWANNWRDGIFTYHQGAEKDVICVGGYPGGNDYDIKYGKPEERPAADKHIEALPMPDRDPVTGNHQSLPEIWALQLMEVV